MHLILSLVPQIAMKLSVTSYNFLLLPKKDCVGHGTQCASIAAGTNYGVAPEATVHSVKVSRCHWLFQGPDSVDDVIKGMNSKTT